MRKILSALAFLIMAAMAHATTYTVKASGGSFTTIQACASVMAAGDTCIVFAGTYNENVTVSSGSSGNQKTMTVNSGDTVFVESFTIGSFVTVNGFQIQNPSSPNSAPCITISPSSTNWQITNNTWTACAALSMTNGTNNSHGLISGNTISYMCSTSASPNVCYAGTVSGDDILINNNHISHVSDGFYMAGAHDYIIGNTFGPTIDTDCGSHSSNCHIDFMQADATVPGGLASTFLTIEGNTIGPMTTTGTGDAHAIGLFQAESCGGNCNNGIVRFNVGAHVNGGAVIDDNSGNNPPPAAWDFVKVYNNTWVYDGLSAAGNGLNSFDHGSFGGADLNDIFVLNFTTSNWNPYECGGSGTNTCPPATPLFTYGHNLVWCTLDGTTSASPCAPFGHQYGSGAWTSDPGNIISNPNFVNLSGSDFHLQSGSPALNAGTSLTTVASGDSGSGTSLIVTDAGFFQDGAGISGVSADCIAVTTVSNHVCVTAVNTSTNTLTLASPITRSIGDSVWLYSDASGAQVLTGTAPNMGAFGQSGGAVATPAPPQMLLGMVVTK